MPKILQTEQFSDWFVGLKDRQAVARVLARVARMAEGNPGDVKPVGEGVSETRIDYGPGYRIYFANWRKTLIVLLGGGDKKTQVKDIKSARALWEAWKEENHG